MSANDKQVGGTHYPKDGEQHWDRMYRLYGRGYFVGCATKYLERYHLKNGKEDLEKSIHFIEKLIELEYNIEKAIHINMEGVRPAESVKHPTDDSLIDKQKYPDDYQEQLSFKMDKMREDAMTGVPEHLREEMMRQYSMKAALDHHITNEGAISPMLKNFWGGEEPLSDGYVDQDR